MGACRPVTPSIVIDDDHDHDDNDDHHDHDDYGHTIYCQCTIIMIMITMVLMMVTHQIPTLRELKSSVYVVKIYSNLLSMHIAQS